MVTLRLLASRTGTERVAVLFEGFAVEFRGGDRGRAHQAGPGRRRGLDGDEHGRRSRREQGADRRDQRPSVSTGAEPRLEVAETNATPAGRMSLSVTRSRDRAPVVPVTV